MSPRPRSIEITPIFFLKIAGFFGKSDGSKHHTDNLHGIYLQKSIVTVTHLDGNDNYKPRSLC